MKRSVLLLAFLFLAVSAIIADTIIVDQNGTGDYVSIQEAIVNANTGDTVLVYPGDYIEVVNFLGKDIVVGSLFLTTQDTSYISQTIIDGNYENPALVRFINGESSDAVLTGFTITKAHEGAPYLNGLGIHINNSSPTIKNNRIINNHYDEWYFDGGGIVLENSSAVITDNLISNNDHAYMGGGIYVKNCINVRIENNIIEHNIALSGYGVSYGAGIYIDTSQYITINNNVLRENTFNNLGNGAGIYILGCNKIKITNNIFSGNGYNCNEGGGLYSTGSSELYLANNLFYDNVVDWFGAGMAFYDSDLIILLNNTIADNQTADNYGYGGGIYCYNSNPVIVNTVFYFNEAGVSGNQVYLDANSDPSFFYCDIEGGLEGFGMNDTVVYNGLYENNIDANPLFMLSGEHPYCPGEGSPCINAGNPDTTGLFIPEYDLAGNTRLVHDTIDIGAYEYQFTTGIDDNEVSGNFTVYPNPAKEVVIVSLRNKPSHLSTLTITSANGMSVMSMPILHREVKCDISTLPEGIYFVTLKNGNSTFTSKLVHY